MRQQIQRNSFYDETLKRIDILDSRFYQKEGTDIYYPSVTTYLEAFPKGYALTEWHKALGFNADIVLQKAATEGSNVHNAIDSYLKGNIVKFGSFDSSGNFHENYTLTEWKMICKFVEFWTTFKPTLIASEVTLISDRYKSGGTADIICQITDNKDQVENWLIDTKTGNSIYDSHELQLSAYAIMWNEINPDYPIERAGILHLKADTRGPDKSGKKIQGKGWQLKEFDRHYADAFKIYQKVQDIWLEQNPNYKPATTFYPIELKLEHPNEDTGLKLADY